MTPEAAYLLAKGRESLADAQDFLKMKKSNPAGRAAYQAAFHVAQAYIFQKTNKIAKTHKGVHNRFYDLTKDDKRIDAKLAAFLPQAYNLKAIADYEYGPNSNIPLEKSSAAVETAKHFVACLEKMIEDR